MTLPGAMPEPSRGEKAFGRNFSRESAALREELSSRKTPLLNDLLDLTTYMAYVEKLLRNARINHYLKKHHQPVLGRMERLMAELRNSKIDLDDNTVTVWSYIRVKAEIEELIRQCKVNGPQYIRTRHEPVVIVITLRRWRAVLRRYPELEEFVFQKTIRRTLKDDLARASKTRATGSSSSNEGGRSAA